MSNVSKRGLIDSELILILFGSLKHQKGFEARIWLDLAAQNDQNRHLESEFGENAFHRMPLMLFKIKFYTLKHRFYVNFTLYST